MSVAGGCATPKESRLRTGLSGEEFPEGTTNSPNPDDKVAISEMVRTYWQAGPSRTATAAASACAGRGAKSCEACAVRRQPPQYASTAGRADSCRPRAPTGRTASPPPRVGVYGVMAG